MISSDNRVRPGYDIPDAMLVCFMILQSTEKCALVTRGSSAARKMHFSCETYRPVLRFDAARALKALRRASFFSSTTLTAVVLDAVLGAVSAGPLLCPANGCVAPFSSWRGN